MTAISASHGCVRTTHFERALLWTSAALNHVVTHRLERRAAERDVAAARAAAADTHAAAEAYRAVGMLPR